MIEAGKISKLLKRKKIKTEDLQKILLDKYGIDLTNETLRAYRTQSKNISPSTLTALAEILDTTEQEFFVDSYWKKKKIASEILSHDLLKVVIDDKEESIFIDKKLIAQKYHSPELRAKELVDGSTLVYHPTLTTDSSEKKSNIQLLKISSL